MNHGRQLFRLFQKSNRSHQKLKCSTSCVLFLRCFRFTSYELQLDLRSRFRSSKYSQEPPWHRCRKSFHVNTFLNSEDGKKENETDLNVDLDLDPDKSNVLKDDPELKELVEEMKRDFNENVQNEEDPRLNDIVKETATSYEEYDYRYAEDIEEYDEHEQFSEDKHKGPEKVLPISLNRGQTGVFDVEELHTLLDVLGAENVVTLQIPSEANFCDIMVVASAKSKRHLQAMNEELLWVHKRKKWPSDPTLVIEGLDKSHWCAMDMGNIVLHLFYGEAREYYDIESLWTLGPDLDPKCQEKVEDPFALSSEDLFWLEASKLGHLEPGESRTARDGDATDQSKPGDPCPSSPGVKPDL